MAYEQRDNSGTLGKNTRRETDKHPEYAGAAVIGGVAYWVSAWIKANGSTGEKFFSLSFKPKDERPVKAKAAPPEDDLDGDIPFAWAFAVPVAGLLAAIVSSVPIA